MDIFTAFTGIDRILRLTLCDKTFPFLRWASGGGGVLEGHPMTKHNRPSSLVNIIILNNRVRVRVGVLKYLPEDLSLKKKINT